MRTEYKVHKSEQKLTASADMCRHIKFTASADVLPPSVH